MIDITHADDLRKVYLQAFDSFAIVPSDITGKDINSRYARELLGALVKGGLLTVSEGDDGDCWQVIDPGTYDDHTREEAEAVIDKWLGIQAPRTPESATSPSRSKLTSAAVGPHDCNCGCGETITTKAMYRPGHDARHAGQIGRKIAQDGDESALDALPTEALQAKARRVANNAMTRIARSGVRDPGPKPKAVDGTAKVGKNEVPARRYPDGVVEVLTPGKDWATASKSAAKTFQEG